jgi:hypothetical protein
VHIIVLQPQEVPLKVHLEKAFLAELPPPVIHLELTAADYDKTTKSNST